MSLGKTYFLSCFVGVGFTKEHSLIYNSLLFMKAYAYLNDSSLFCTFRAIRFFTLIRYIIHAVALCQVINFDVQTLLKCRNKNAVNFVIWKIKSHQLGVQLTAQYYTLYIIIIPTLPGSLTFLSFPHPQNEWHNVVLFLHLSIY